MTDKTLLERIALWEQEDSQLTDAQIKELGDIIAGLAEQSAQGRIIQAQEIVKLKAQLDQAVDALKKAEKALNALEPPWPDFATMVEAYHAVKAAIAATEEE